MNSEQQRKARSAYWGNIETIRVMRKMFAEGQGVYDYLNDRLKAEKHDEATIYRLLYEVALNSNDQADIAKTVKMLVEEYGAKSVPFELHVSTKQLFLLKANHEMVRYLQERTGNTMRDDLVIIVTFHHGMSGMCTYYLRDHCEKIPELKQYVKNLAEMPRSPNEERERSMMETLNEMQRSLIDEMDNESF